MPAISTSQTQFGPNEQITSAKLNNILLQSQMASGAVTLDGTLTVVAGQLQVGVLKATNYQVGGITAVALADNAVTTAKILDANVTTAKLANLSVTAGKIAVGAIIGAVPSNFPIQVVGVAKSDIQEITPNAWTDITGLSLTLTRAVASATGKVMIQGVIMTDTNNSEYGLAIRIRRGNNTIGVGDLVGSRSQATSQGSHGGTYGQFPIPFHFIDSAPGSAATVTYQIQVRSSTGVTGYINRDNNDVDNGNATYRTISTMTLTELSP
jgi:hypothetical protein